MILSQPEFHSINAQEPTPCEKIVNVCFKETLSSPESGPSQFTNSPHGLALDSFHQVPPPWTCKKHPEQLF